MNFRMPIDHLEMLFHINNESEFFIICVNILNKISFFYPVSHSINFNFPPYLLTRKLRGGVVQHFQSQIMLNILDMGKVASMQALNLKLTSG